MIDVYAFTGAIIGALTFILIIFGLAIYLSPNNTTFWALILFTLLSIGLVMIYFLVAPSELTSDGSGNTFFSGPVSPITYYSYNPDKQTLTRLNLGKTLDNKPLSDYFHKNDETIFVANDGTIVSILGNMTRKFQTLPGTKKIRILNNQYVALANGRIYTSKDLQSWKLDSSKPNNILDIDVPADQSNLLHIQTPKENLIIDANQNKVLSTSKSETKKYGSNYKQFVRFADNGIHIHDKNFEKGYLHADIDHYNRVYLVPKSVSGYSVKDLYTSDQLALIGLQTKNGPDIIQVGEQIKFHQTK